MFASSPALSSMDHPVYDVWLLDCTDKVGGDTAKAGAREKAEQKDPTDKNDEKAQQPDRTAVEERDETVIERERLPAQ
jgi:hypothetical protein